MVGAYLAFKVVSLTRVRLFVTPWTVAYQAPQSMEFSRQEFWSGLPFPSPGDLPDPGIEPRSPALRALPSDCFTSEPPGKPLKTGPNCFVKVLYYYTFLPALQESSNCFLILTNTWHGQSF